jgi:hypothetical protein
MCLCDLQREQLQKHISGEILGMFGRLEGATGRFCDICVDALHSMMLWLLCRFKTEPKSGVLHKKPPVCIKLHVTSHSILRGLGSWTRFRDI